MIIRLLIQSELLIFFYYFESKWAWDLIRGKRKKENKKKKLKISTIRK